ncbi:uncharacterized protein LOC6573258 [Drosophila mojavensis]|uniref:Protein TsetseEP domain-containing protein n=1 Tax=Drosophila mojavensis TaxID=7230 RepID=B4KCI7_DROMO|nr:uncharacterized protein LOC6573258 [Drosophila mojavensis]EDW14806.1 uncharacterized protein Dmoj_GI24461 [Drosophila mojavensis]
MTLKVIVVLMALTISVALARNLQPSLKAGQKIRQLHSESLALAETHQSTSTTCFSTYNPLLSQVASNYEVEYERCIQAYETCSSNIDNLYKSARLELESSVYQSCRSLSNCNMITNAYSAFTCASTTAAEDSKIFYSISANASDLAARSKADYIEAETAKSVCINLAEKNYVEDTSRVYGQLNNCLLGYDIPNPPTIGTATPPPTYDDTTPDPDEDYTTWKYPTDDPDSSK